MRSSGKVAFYDSERGFGFVTPDDGATKDVFVHVSCIADGGDSVLRVGERVEFDTEAGTKGPRAVNVVRMGDD